MDTTFLAPVDGGSLTVHRGGTPGAPPVLLVHGITGSGMSWLRTSESLRDLDVIAPDLRGRGGSGSLTAPFGIVQHADDLEAVLDHLGLGTATVAGHSMGGFVAVAFAARHPDRLAGLVLVDGGIPLALPEDVDPDAAVQTTLRPSLQRLSMTFADPEAYRDFWRAHPAFDGHLNEYAQAYVDYDLTGDEPALHSKVNPDAVAVDSRDMVELSLTGTALPLRSGTPLLRAPRGLVNELPGLYPPEHAAAWADRTEALELVEVPGINHYTILFDAVGVEAVVRAIRGQLPAPG
ncbi:MAG: alpha/beta fold hydrolase [Nocardioidaceae bacterium]